MKKESDNIIVSICCLAYNHEEYIEQAIEGFLMQDTNFQIEILIHDDASTDRTRKIIEKYHAEYPNLIKPIYQEENQYSKGIKPIFKYLFPRAKGKYIALCEGDDYWTDSLKLQKQVDFLNNNLEYNVCGTYSDILIKTIDKKRKILSFETFAIINLLTAKGNIPPTLTLCFRNNIVDYTRFEPFEIGDRPLLIELTKNGAKIAKLPYITGVYRYHGKGVNSGNSRYKNIKIFMNIRFYYLDEFKNNKELKNGIRLYFINTGIGEVKSAILFRGFDFRIIYISLVYLFRSLKFL